MTHRFNVKHLIAGVTLQETRQLVCIPEFHEAVAKKAPGHNLNILVSSIASNLYQMRREVTIDARIPDLAKKLLKDALKVFRTEEWDIVAMTCLSNFKLNMPAEFRCKISLIEGSGGVIANHDWEIDVHVPLISGILAKHAESEIRRFNAIEIEIINQEILAHIKKKG